MRNSKVIRDTALFGAKFLKVVIACDDIVNIDVCSFTWATFGLKSGFNRGRLDRVIGSYGSQKLARLAKVEGSFLIHESGLPIL